MFLFLLLKIPKFINQFKEVLSLCSNTKILGFLGVSLITYLCSNFALVSDFLLISNFLGVVFISGGVSMLPSKKHFVKNEHFYHMISS